MVFVPCGPKLATLRLDLRSAVSCLPLGPSLHPGLQDILHLSCAALHNFSFDSPHYCRHLSRLCHARSTFSTPLILTMEDRLLWRCYMVSARGEGRGARHLAKVWTSQFVY